MIRPEDAADAVVLLILIILIGFVWWLFSTGWV